MLYDKPWYRRSKFWTAVVTALLVILNEGLDLGLDSNAVLSIAGVAIGYILGQGYVDAKTPPVRW